MLAIVENTRRKQLDWITAILQHRGWRISRLAQEAGISHSTLSKFVSDPLNAAQLNSGSVEKIAGAGGIPPYYNTPVAQPKGFSAGEAEPFKILTGDPAGQAVRALAAGRNTIEAWVLRSRALEAAGFIPGDILIVDHAATPQDGDAVCVKILDRTGRPETAFRILEAPFLVAASLDQGFSRRPILIDNDRTELFGVVTESLRPRLTH